MRGLSGIIDWLRNHRRPKPLPPPVEPPSGDVLNNLIVMHNSIRRQYGLQPLRRDSHLMAAADKHANWMQANGQLTHNGDGDPGQRITAAGYAYQAYGENIASGYPDVQAVMTGWMHSRGHRRNILTPYFTDIGVALVGGYWCVDFGTRSPSAPAVKFAFGGIVYEPK